MTISHQVSNGSLSQFLILPPCIRCELTDKHCHDKNKFLVTGWVTRIWVGVHFFYFCWCVNVQLQLLVKNSPFSYNLFPLYIYADDRPKKTDQVFSGCPKKFFHTGIHFLQNFVSLTTVLSMNDVVTMLKSHGSLNLSAFLHFHCRLFVVYSPVLTSKQQYWPHVFRVYNSLLWFVFS